MLELWDEEPKKSKTKTAVPASSRVSKTTAVRVATRGTLPPSDWTLPHEFPRLSGVVGLDLETRDPSLKLRGPGWATGDGEVVGVALAWGNGERGYWPIRHESGGNLDVDMVLGFVGELIADSSVTIVGHNLLYDLGWLRREGHTHKAKLVDTFLAASLLDEYRTSYSLDAVSKTYLGTGKDESLLEKSCKAWGLNGKDDLWRLPPTHVGPYAEVDASQALALWRTLEPLLKGEELDGVFSLETRLLPLLLEMRWRGVRVDLERAENGREVLLAKEEEILRWLEQKAGKSVDIWAADSIASACDSLGILYERTATDRPSFRQDWLTSHEHPFCKALVKARSLNKTRTTFLEGYILGMNTNGRIHAQFNQLRSDASGTVSGRFSSSNPNLQNLPARDDSMGPWIRSLLLPEEGQLWSACDYSQQEPRLTVHYAALSRAPGAEKAVDAYRNDPTTDYHQLVADLTGLPRKQAKALNLGMIYGMGGAKLCSSLGLPTKIITTRSGQVREIAGEEGETILQQYHERMPFVKALQEDVTRRAENRGFIRTLLGRRCRFGKEGKDFAYKALNRLIQGSAADQSKAAMLSLWEDHQICPLVIVHDEIGVSVSSETEAKKVAHVMETAVDLLVPSKVDVAIGETWGTAKE